MNLELKMRQVKQILNNALVSDETRVKLIRSVVANDYGKITRTDAYRLKQVLRGFGYSYLITGPLSDRTFSAQDRKLLDRGLLKYTVVASHRDLFVTAVGKRALEAYEATIQY